MWVKVTFKTYSKYKKKTTATPKSKSDIEQLIANTKKTTATPKNSIIVIFTSAKCMNILSRIYYAKKHTFQSGCDVLALGYN